MHLFHDYEAVSSQLYLRSQRLGAEVALSPELLSQVTKDLLHGVGIAMTRILYRCRKCSEVKAEEIEGYWTLAEITGRVPALATGGPHADAADSK